MAVPSTRPNWFDNTETGAPQITDAAGSFLAVLKACLVNGFNLRPVTQIVVTGGVALATSADHGYSGAYGKLLLISGAADAGLNGRVQPYDVQANTFRYACPGVPDGTYSGGITAVRAPLGWSVLFENGAGTQAVLQRLDPTASSAQMHVLDTRAAPAQNWMSQVSMVEAATGFDTFTNQAPGSLNGRTWMHGAAGSGNRRWRIAGDSLAFWALLQSGQSPHTLAHPYFFGDHVPMYPAEVSAALLVGYGQTAPNTGSIASVAPGNFAPTAGHAFLTFHKVFDGSAVGEAGSLAGAGNWGRSLFNVSEDTVVPICGDYYTRASGAPRGRMPGLFLPQANLPFTDLSEHYLEPLGRVLVAYTIAASNNGLSGQMMLDMTGPWR
jgi:hypothetical protein